MRSGLENGPLATSPSLATKLAWLGWGDSNAPALQMGKSRPGQGNDLSRGVRSLIGGELASWWWWWWERQAALKSASASSRPGSKDTTSAQRLLEPPTTVAMVHWAPATLHLPAPAA